MQATADAAHEEQERLEQLGLGAGVEAEGAAEAVDVADPAVLPEYDLGADLGISPAAYKVELKRLWVSDDAYRASVRRLNPEQRAYFDHLMLHLGTRSDSQLLDFLSGGAGVGKSTVIRAAYQGALRMYGGQEGDSEGNSPVLVVAHTGKAAHNIGRSVRASSVR